jgi:hypothetical protein
MQLNVLMILVDLPEAELNQLFDILADWNVALNQEISPVDLAPAGPSS